ncbi:MAG: hypothetical protein QW724_04825 [Nitrososphaerota archaeon]
MRKIKVRVGGGSVGKLVYWAYEICGDVLQNQGWGFRFLQRRDKMKVMCHLYGLRSALTDIYENKVRAVDGRVQYLVKYYCGDENVFKLLSKWGYGFRDPLIIEKVNSIKNLVNKIGLLDLVRTVEGKIENRLKKMAARRFYSMVKRIFEDSYTWEFSDKMRYVVYRLPKDSEDIPLEFLARRIIEKEKKNGGVEGVAVIRDCGNLTRIFFYDVDGKKHVVDALKKADRSYRGGWIGSFKTLYVSGSPTEEIEEMLAEVAENVQVK